jgi:hypothetical protein
MTVYAFEFTDEFLWQGYTRHKRCVSRIRAWLKATILFSLLLLVVFASWYGRPVDTLLLGIAAMTALFTQLFQKWMLIRSFKKSPYHNDSIRSELSETGLNTAGRASSATIGWQAITKARRLPDGFLLYTGPNLFYWLPSSSQVSGSPNDTEEMIRSNVTDYETLGLSA